MVFRRAIIQTIAASRLMRIGLVISTTLLVTSCRTWVTHSPRPDTMMAMSETGPLRVTRTDGTAITLFDVIVFRDSLAGVLENDSAKRIAVPLAEVAKVERRELYRPVRYARNYLFTVVSVGTLLLLWAVL